MTEHKPDRKFVKDVLEVCNASATTRASMQVAIIREMCLEALYGPDPGGVIVSSNEPLGVGFEAGESVWPIYDR